MMLGANNGRSDFSSSQQQQQQQNQKQRAHPIRPVTIKQLIDAQRVGDGALVIDGREASQVTVVGHIMSYENEQAVASGALTAKHYGYIITDHTGSLVVRQWINTDSVQQPIPLYTHVRASGTVKVWRDTLMVTGSVTTVNDSNEINYHMLDAILTHLRLTKGDVPFNSNKPKVETKDVPMMMNTASGVGARNELPGGATNVSLEDLLVRIITQNPNMEGGMSMDELAKKSEQYGFNMSDVRMAIRLLCHDGRVYQTHDNRFSI